MFAERLNVLNSTLSFLAEFEDNTELQKELWDYSVQLLEAEEDYETLAIMMNAKEIYNKSDKDFNCRIRRDG